MFTEQANDLNLIPQRSHVGVGDNVSSRLASKGEMARHSVWRWRVGTNQPEREVGRRENCGTHRALESAVRGDGPGVAEPFERLMEKNSEIGIQIYAQCHSLDFETALERGDEDPARCRRGCCWRMSWPPTYSRE
jgi:hypothetical protein